MLVLEGRKFPYNYYVIEDDANAPACKVADKCFSTNDFKKVIDESDLVTFEFEFVDLKALEYAEEQGKLYPSLFTVKLKRERHKEKLFYKENNLPTPRFLIAENGKEALRILKDEFNNYGVLKQSRGGYDGKNQYFIRGDAEKYEFIKNINEKFIVEEYVNFDFEASIIVTRDRKGNIMFYPPTYNYNEKGILVYNYGPYYNEKISEIAKEILNAMNYVGTMGIEFFIKGDKVLINEFAPRVHNTGHYTLDCAIVSQFENHIRAISDLELGDTKVLSYCGMVNILGTDIVPHEVLKYGKLYWYGKSEVKKRRKMGHINVVGESLNEVKFKINELMKLLYPKGLDL
jgi:5-(carboxyamino)imidazole ribonucleotide synthase